jgi:hypothetical protein
MAGTLRALIETEAPLRPARAVELALGILEALQALHDQGRVHGGVAPERVEVRGGSVRLVEPSPPAGATLEDDVRGAAAILYELLTGAAPDPDAGRPSLRTPAVVPARLDATVERALDGRGAPFESAAALGHELRVCLVDALRDARRPLRPPHRF